jgi:excinuclease ABC subunit C
MKILYPISDQPVYPHIKLTREEFPRALATRVVKNDGDEYFGAFLNRTAVRILIDFINTTFRLRTCTISIDGSFPVPCTQYYVRRCVAPCVSSLCSHDTYLEMVKMVRLFLRDHRELLLGEITQKIEQASVSLDFETAAYYRDILIKVESFWANSRWQVWLEDTVDTLEMAETDDTLTIILISQRRQRTLGTIVYEFPKREDAPPSRALADVIEQFYVHHLPRAIRVSHEFDGRLVLAKSLGRMFGRKISISVIGEEARRITTARALTRTKKNIELQSISAKQRTVDVQTQLKRLFTLQKRPHRIEAFDVAHISATAFAAAVSVWINGGDVPDEYEHWLSDQAGELASLKAFLSRRLTTADPDLILVDGGPSHLNAANRVVSALSRHQPTVIAAVKPRGKHSAISHFLIGDRRIEFDIDSSACRLLQRLRDEAHDLANATHRLSRDMIHFYELASIVPSLNERERQDLLRDVGSIKKITGLASAYLTDRFGSKLGKRIVLEIDRFRRGESPPPIPLIVPIRYVDTDGAAEDLIPIEVRR